MVVIYHMSDYSSINLNEVHEIYDDNTTNAIKEIKTNLEYFWYCCIDTIPEIKTAGLVNPEAFQALINCAKEHENVKFQQIAIALECNSVDSITADYNNDTYHSGIIDDETYSFLSNLRRCIDEEFMS